MELGFVAARTIACLSLECYCVNRRARRRSTKDAKRHDEDLWRGLDLENYCQGMGCDGHEQRRRSSSPLPPTCTCRPNQSSAHSAPCETWSAIYKPPLPSTAPRNHTTHWPQHASAQHNPAHPNPAKFAPQLAAYLPPLPIWHTPSLGHVPHFHCEEPLLYNNTELALSLCLSETIDVFSTLTQAPPMTQRPR